MTKAKTTPATEAKTAAVNVADATTAAVNETTAKVTETTQVARDLFSALTLSGKKTFEGVFAFDKALFGIAKGAVTSYVEHGKATMQAKCLTDVANLQTAYAHSYIENTAANTRELLDLAKTKAEEAYAPMKDAIADIKGDKKAA